ncbi:FAD-binding protein [Cellulomonas sp. PhB143]|uniref:FAD-binding protein n=1 Tax=Cellulomonas sp. PhB143 TaxID=2485186 RepID=UPI000F475A0C|nr:FAD-binding protein [Cellulomonas sp. PhB143]ROS73381.1 xylitol oxidase [Cellulomonas sp. PhB143]
MSTSNWARNLTYSSSRVVRPTTLDELAETVTSSPRVRPLGTRHSFNRVADTDGVHVVVDALDDGRPAVEVDVARGTASIAAGARYGEASQALQEQGVALGAMASLPHISVAGAVATATHGSGDTTRNLAAAVRGLELVTADGAVRTLARGDTDFAGAVVGLGALGIVTRLELDVVPTYDVRQDVYLGLGWDVVAEQLDEITASATSVSLFTGWGDGVDQVWRKTAVRPGSDAVAFPAAYLGAAAATRAMHPLPGVDAAACTEQLGVAGPWNERLPHFRLAFTPSNGEELQSEYLVPRRHAVEAMAALRKIADVVRPLLQITEIRTIAADDLWMSTAFVEGVAAGEQPDPRAGFVGFHFTWLPRQREVEAVLPAIESALAPFGARPHWGKLFTDGPAELADVAGRYPRFADFAALVERYDPAGRFRGGIVDTLLAGA